MKLSSLLLASLLWMIRIAPAADVLEIGPGEEKDLPTGREADGIRGDFVLRNDLVIALVSQNAPLRRANMSTFYGPAGVTPGCLFDLTLRKEQNDQLTCFSPAEQRGEVSYVRMVTEDDPKTAAVETVVSAAKNGGIYKRHEYRLRDGEQGIRIITTLRNEGTEKTRASTKDEWKKFLAEGESADIQWADAVNPADKCGYALGQATLKGVKNAQPISGTFLELEPGQEVTWTRFLAVGHSPLEAWGLVKRMRGDKCGTVAIHLADRDGSAATDGRVILEQEQGKLIGYPDETGTATFLLPEGRHRLVCEAMGRPFQTVEVEIK